MSDDFAKNPWDEDNNTGTRDNHLHSNQDTPRIEREASQSSEKTIPGNRVAFADIPPAVRNALKPIGYAWALLSPEEASHLVSDERTRFFIQNRQAVGRRREVEWPGRLNIGCNYCRLLPPLPHAIRGWW